MTERSLKDKVVLITGGAVGIGYEIADNYLKNGAKVVLIVDVNSNGSKAVEKLTSTHGPGKAVFYKADITSDNDLNIVYDKILKDYNNVDILVNNAGFLGDSAWKKCMDINATYLIGWAMKYWEHMRKDKGGKGGTIINIASIYGFRIDQYLPVYQASKFAVIGFTRSLGHEYNYERTGVRVFAICPGFTKTDMTLSNTPKTWIDEKLSEDFDEYTEHFVEWQNVDVVGEAAVDAFVEADSGTAWLIEGSKPITLVP